ncbi:MAG: peptide chain release factor N(5)-glutamine methyltransferase [Alphaproteobacteria bacterium]|nr:peptide chain release factor N(5)-glutamine methyltransferase [Alphaproteobacteria bacterium]
MTNIRWLVDLLKDISDVPEYEAKIIAEKQLDNAEIEQILNRRRQGEPLSKILEEKGFYKYIFKTTSDVLDPRADSEILVESVSEFVPDTGGSIKILDIGTGSGCLLISTMMEYQNAVGVGIDKSEMALKIAQENAQAIAKDKNISFIYQDIICDNWAKGLGQFDIIISNPPYIKSIDIDGLDVAVKQYDPMLALDGGEDGLMFYRQLAETLMPITHEKTKIFFEIGQGQEADVTDLMQQNGFSLLATRKDYGNIIRVLVFERG